MALSDFDRNHLKTALGNSAAATHIADALDAVVGLSAGETALVDGVTAGTWAAGKALTLNANADATAPEACDIAFGTTTGTKLGTAAAQKIAFHDATPVIQRAGEDQAAVTPSTDFSGSDTVDESTILAAVQAVETLVNELRAALVEKGLIKGAA